MKSLWSAIGFLTILPTPKQVPNAQDLKTAWVWFPLTGLIVGAIGGGAFWLAVYADCSVELSAILAVITLVTITRGFHHDGLADVADASFGGYTIEDRLRIMKDPHVGSFAVLALILAAALEVQAIANLTPNQALVVMPVAGLLSRLAVIWPMLWLPYAKPNGLGKLFSKSAGHYLITLITSCGLAQLLVGPISACLITLVIVIALAVSWFAKQRFGGMTGDVCGCIIISCEIATLIMFPLLSKVI